MHSRLAAPGSGPLGPLAHASWLGQPAQLAAWPACSCSGPTQSAPTPYDCTVRSCSRAQTKAGAVLARRLRPLLSLNVAGHCRALLVRLASTRAHEGLRSLASSGTAPAGGAGTMMDELLDVILYFSMHAFPNSCVRGALHQYPAISLVRRCACVDLFGSSRRAAAAGHHAARRVLPQLCAPCRSLMPRRWACISSMRHRIC